MIFIAVHSCEIWYDMHRSAPRIGSLSSFRRSSWAKKVKRLYPPGELWLILVSNG